LLVVILSAFARPAAGCRERRVDHVGGVVKGAFMSLGVMNAPFTTCRVW
jgi:hypothetical protein